MIGFINERSLEEHGNCERALLLFLDAAHQLIAIQAPLMKDSEFFSDAAFKKRFGSLSFPADVRGLIRQVVFSERYYKCWRPGRISTDDIYSCATPHLDLLDESLCEATELKIRDPDLDVAALTAADSEFRHYEELVVSNSSSGHQVALRNITSFELVTRWITQQRGYYSPNSRESPKDFQTILAKSPRFHPTGKVERYGSRQIYEDSETRRLYYVCQKHSGSSAHLEVFSPDKQHYGKADIDSAELISPKIKGRSLKL
jgi:hypothetical protein